MFVGALRIEIFIPTTHTLKEKRGVITPILEGLRNRHRVAVAETGFQDLWQRCEIGVSAVAGTASHVEDVLRACESYVWSHPEIEVTTVDWLWLDE